MASFPTLPSNICPRAGFVPDSGITTMNYDTLSQVYSRLCHHSYDTLPETTWSNLKYLFTYCLNSVMQAKSYDICCTFWQHSKLCHASDLSFMSLDQVLGYKLISDFVIRCHIWPFRPGSRQQLLSLTLSSDLTYLSLDQVQDHRLISNMVIRSVTPGLRPG